MEISTAFFTGNQVPIVAIDVRMDDGDWCCVLERAALAPDRDHALDVTPADAREVRIRCYQEGGIARVKLFGTPLPNPAPDPINLLATAAISHVSNEHYGNPAMAVRGVRNEDHMIGWESARTGFGERALFSLASPARCRHLVVDTYLHRLNPPLSCHLFGLPAGTDPDQALARGPRWAPTLRVARQLRAPLPRWLLRTLGGGRDRELRIRGGEAARRLASCGAR